MSARLLKITIALLMLASAARQTHASAPMTALGSVRGVAFEDRNSNGARDAGEALLSGLLWRISAGTWSVTGVSGGDGTFGPTVRPGDYNFVGLDSPGWRVTTPARQVTVTGVGVAALGNDIGYARTGAPLALGSAVVGGGSTAPGAAPTHEIAAGAKNPDVLIGNRGGSFGFFVAAAKGAGVIDALYADGDFTVFAPTDAAWAKIPRDRLDSIVLNPGELARILRNHIVPKRLTPALLARARSENTLGDSALTFQNIGGAIVLSKAANVSGGVETRNGMVYAVDSVIGVSLK